MVISHSTAEQLATVIKRHVQNPAAFISDLADVTGNKSFRDTIHVLQNLLDQGKLQDK